MMTPLADRVLIAPDPIVTETKSGIALVEDWPQETSGRVTSIGAGVHDVAVDDRVLFAQHSGQVLEMNGQRLFVMRERDVIAILEAE